MAQKLSLEKRTGAADRKLVMPDSARSTGLGDAGSQARKDIIKLFAAACGINSYAMPTIAETKWVIEGPMTHDSVQRAFDSEINVFGASKPITGGDGVDDVISTPGLSDGEFQTYNVLCSIGVHIRPTPFCFTARGNAIVTPTANGVAKQVSPDVWTCLDQTTPVCPTTSPTGSAIPSTMVPATLWYGWWFNYAMWAFVRGYNLRWTFGSLQNIMDEELRNTAYVPPGVQEGSASSSLTSLEYLVLGVNNRYEQTLGSTLSFLMANARRVGALPGANKGASSFAASRDDEFVEWTLGGIDLRSALCGNNEFRTLDNPFIAKPGVKLGLLFQENSEIDGNDMRAFLDVTQGLSGAGVPPVFTEEAHLATTCGTSFAELALDGSSVFCQTLPAGRALFKGGGGDITVKAKGWEVDDTLAETIKKDTDLQAELVSTCGCCCS